MCHCQVLGHTQGGLLELTYNPNLPVKTGAGWRSFQGNHLQPKVSSVEGRSFTAELAVLGGLLLVLTEIKWFSWQPVKKPSVKVLETSIKRNMVKKKIDKLCGLLFQLLQLSLCDRYLSSAIFRIWKQESQSLHLTSLLAWIQNFIPFWL